MPSSAPDLATGNLVRLTSSNSRDGARVHAFVLEVVLERRRFFDYLGPIPRLCVSLARPSEFIENSPANSGLC